MIAKYPGKCAKSGQAIRPGDVISFTAARRPVLVHRAYPENPTLDNATPYARVQNNGVSDVFVFSGEDGSRAFYRNKAGRCEDAPCCGCCTI
jgi:hypothetical protein